MPLYIFKKMSDNEVHALREILYGKNGNLTAEYGEDTYTFRNAQGHAAKYFIHPASGLVQRIEYTPDDASNDLQRDEREDAIMFALNREVDQREGGRRRRRRRRGKTAKKSRRARRRRTTARRVR